MKKAGLLLTLLVASLAACKKKDCWKCTSREVGGAATILPGSKAVTEETVCEKDAKQVREYEKSKSGTKSYEENGSTYTLTTETTCK